MTSHGVQNEAVVPTPSRKLQLPEPARVVTAPDSTLRALNLWPPLSTTYNNPEDALNASPTGALKVAAIPIPSVDPAVPLPAIVLTTPEGLQDRTLLLEVSPMYTVEVIGFTVMPWGALNEAVTPVPSMKAFIPLPASVLTVKVPGETTRSFGARLMTYITPVLG